MIEKQIDENRVAICRPISVTPSSAADKTLALARQLE